MLRKPGCNPLTSPGRPLICAEILTLALIALQCNGVISWAWWWLVSPIWILLLGVFLFFLPIFYRIHRGK